MTRPNIVFIIADDVTPAYHGCYGGPSITPNIDRLAREGALFARSHGVSPLCNPSRYSIFTGQYPGRACSVTNRSCSPEEPYSIHQNADLQPTTPSLARLLSDAGYFTGHVGKWHSNFQYAGTANEWPTGRLGPDADLDDPEIDSLLGALHERHRAVVRECGGFAWADAVHWGNLNTNHPRAIQHHNPAWLTDTALRFLDEAASRCEQPFYLHVAHTLPHGPDPDQSLGADHSYTPAGRLPRCPSSHPPDCSVLERLSAAGLQTSGCTASIAAGIVQVDDQIGILRRRLEEMEVLDNTLFIYTADHGIHGKGTCYRGGWHLPLVIRHPRSIAAGRCIPHAVSHVDFLPTLCEYANARVPDGFLVDGISYRPLLTGENTASTREFTYQEMGVARSIVSGRWHYIVLRYPESVLAAMASADCAEAPSLHAYEDSFFCDFNFINKPHYFEPEQLYDLDADPCERNNLIHDPAYTELAATMREQLHRVTDTLPGPYRRDTPPFQMGPRYHRLVELRRLRTQRSAHHPHGFDQEKIYNLCLPDPFGKW